MPRPPTNLHQKVKDLLQHTGVLPPESNRPLDHFDHATNDGIGLIRYIEQHLQSTRFYEAVYQRHMVSVRRMVLGSLLQAFERFIKELAIVCVDEVAGNIYDGRFDRFEPSGAALAFNFRAGTIGKALCESDTWLNNASISDRFGHTLKSHFSDHPWEALFPNERQQPHANRDRARTLNILWQVRHNLAHNVGALTGSDAVKLQLIAKQRVNAGRLLSPNPDDLRYVIRFLSETAEWLNDRVGRRLAELLQELHAENPTLFDPQQKADAVSGKLGFSVTIAGAVGHV